MIRVVVVPRVVSPYPLRLEISDANDPVRARDDLDPYAPPLEYADGSVSWSGCPSREARDAARERSRIREAQEASRQDLARHARQVADLERQRRALQERVAACSGHAAASESEPRCYTGPVSESRPGSEYNRAAHGNIEITETCRCGAQRHTLVNGRHKEHSGWTRHYAELDAQLAFLGTVRS